MSPVWTTFNPGADAPSYFTSPFQGFFYYCVEYEGRTAQSVSKPGLTLNEACRGVQMYAHKASFFSGFQWLI